MNQPALHPEKTASTDSESDRPTPAAGGWLALVATPIGNLDDITLRALRVLREAEVIAAEDTRRAGVLCAKFEIHARLIPYHAHNEHHCTQGVLDMVLAGRKVAMLSDAGTPALSDPGFFLVRAALERGIEPQVVPGVSSLTFAVVAAGLPVDRFAFYGFLPVKAGKRRALLEQVRDAGMTAFLFESPFRVTRLLTEIVAYLGPRTSVAIVREATKLHEECLRGSAAELLARHGQRAWKGEFVVGIGRVANADVTGTEKTEFSDETEGENEG